MHVGRVGHDVRLHHAVVLGVHEVAGVLSPGVRHGGHALGGAPQGGYHAVIGGGHQDDGEEEHDHHLVHRHYHPQHGGVVQVTEQLQYDDHYYMSVVLVTMLCW